jgi:hypothetical protein
MVVNICVIHHVCMSMVDITYRWCRRGFNALGASTESDGSQMMMAAGFGTGRPYVPTLSTAVEDDIGSSLTWLMSVVQRRLLSRPIHIIYVFDAMRRSWLELILGLVVWASAAGFIGRV